MRSLGGGARTEVRAIVPDGNKIRGSPTWGYCLVVKKNGTLTHAATGMDLENTVLSA